MVSDIVLAILLASLIGAFLRQPLVIGCLIIASGVAALSALFGAVWYLVTGSMPDPFSLVLYTVGLISLCLALGAISIWYDKQKVT